MAHTWWGKTQMASSGTNISNTGILSYPARLALFASPRFAFTLCYNFPLLSFSHQNVSTTALRKEPIPPPHTCAFQR